MSYTFEPKHRYAKASGRDVRISTKSAEIICRVIRKKTLTRSKRLLNNLLAQKQSLEGKYYTKTVRGILSMLDSCEKNAEFLGLDTDRLFVHASAHMGTIMRRRRRKAAFGSRMKTTHIEIILIERGKEEQKGKVSRSKVKETLKKKEETEVDKELREERDQLEKEIQKVKQKEKKLVEEEKVLHALDEAKLEEVKSES